MTSASAVINNILLQLNDYIPQGYFDDVRMVLYINLCDYSFEKNKDTAELTSNLDAAYEAIRRWQQELIVEGLVKSTITQYSRELKQLMLYTGMSPLEMTESHIRNYLAHGKIERRWKDKTFNSKVRSLRSFFKWAYTEDVMKNDPMKKIKETREEFRMGNILSPEQREIFRCACRTNRELAIVDLLYSSGGRISEICQLNINDLDYTNRRMIIYGKGKKEREIYFSAQARVHIVDYLEGRDDNNPALFVSGRIPHQRLTKDGIRYILKDIQKRDDRLKNIKISPHVFRRTCGTDMLNRGAPIEMVKEKLGHEKADTTLHCYAKISREAVRDAERKFGAA